MSIPESGLVGLGVFSRTDSVGVSSYFSIPQHTPAIQWMFLYGIILHIEYQISEFAKQAPLQCFGEEVNHHLSG
jgi:hypothetical protein